MKNQFLTILLIIVLISCTSKDQILNDYNQRDDLKLIDEFLKTENVPLDKEIELQLNSIKQKYSSSIYSLYKGKVLYSKGNFDQGRKAFLEVPQSSQHYEKMLLAYFKLAEKNQNQLGQNEASKLYFEFKKKPLISKDYELMYQLRVMFNQYMKQVLELKDPQKQKEELTRLKPFRSQFGYRPLNIPKEYKFLYNITCSGESEITPNFKFSKIEFERTPCHGECPVDKLTLTSDGKVIYEGIFYVDNIGRYEFDSGLENFAKLSYFIEDQKILSLQDNYTASWTSDSSKVLRVYDEDSQLLKSIRDYGRQGPIKLKVFFDAIESISHNYFLWKKRKK